MTKKIKTEWDLTLLYQSKDDSQIEKDLQEIEAAYDGFAKKYVGREDYLKDANLLAGALKDLEDLDARLAPSKPYLYFNYRHDLNSRDTAAEARLNDLSQRYSKLANKTVFFGVALARINAADQSRYLAEPALVPYRYFLKCVFDHAKHVLSEPEERLLNLKSLPAHGLWVRGTEKVLGGQTIKWRGRKISLSEAMAKGAALPTVPRRALGDLINERFKSLADFAENELNAIVLDKKIDDELRGYNAPYSATVLGYQNEEATVQNLINTVSKHFPLAHRFYRLKAKMLGLKTLTYADRGAEVGRAKNQIPFAQAVEIVRQAFRQIAPVYAETFAEMLRRGQIDVFPKVGKQGGAYCSSGTNLPTFVLLNHVPNLYSVTTLAHELGHAFHAKFSAESQPPLYRDHTIATAEVASTFFENFVFDQILPLLSPREQVVALHDRIAGAVATIFRQIACFNFEWELHRQIRAKGSLPKVEIAKLLNKHMAAYLGPVFKLTENDGYFFVYWSHLRNFFYVYSYAFGELVSGALYERYRQDRGFEKNVRQFLSAGGSASPEDILARVGLNVRHPDFFELGLKKLEVDINKLESLIK